MCRATVVEKQHTNNKYGFTAGTARKTHNTEMKNITIVSNECDNITCVCVLVLSCL